MATQKDFDSFLSNIEPSSSTVSYVSSIQTNLRKYLKEHEFYKNIHVDTFLSGSYAKHTSIRPVVDDKKRDVDIIVVTNYSSIENPLDVLKELKNVLVEKREYETATIQKHSVGIEMSGISIDVVPVIVDENDDNLYYIGNSDSGDWNITDPKGHKAWATNINKDNNDKYKPLVKVFKWWRRHNCPEEKKYPKGIALEKIICDNLGDSSLCTEDFMIDTIQNIISAYKEDYVDKKMNPTIDDPSEKIDNNDLLSGYELDDFKSFIEKLEEHAELLNEEGKTNETWRKILGTEFPKKVTTDNSLAYRNFQKCIQAPHKQRPKWPIQRGGAAFIVVNVANQKDENIEYANNGKPLEKGCKLYFRALTGVKKPYTVMWQIVNTGYEARQAECLRGNFEQSNNGEFGRFEVTSYTGSHSVQCFIIKKGVCVARSKEFIINIQ